MLRYTHTNIRKQLKNCRKNKTHTHTRVHMRQTENTFYDDILRDLHKNDEFSLPLDFRGGTLILHKFQLLRGWDWEVAKNKQQCVFHIHYMFGGFNIYKKPCQTYFRIFPHLPNFWWFALLSFPFLIIATKMKIKAITHTTHYKKRKIQVQVALQRRHNWTSIQFKR